jgi:putative ABC transport system substrate-binding protein
MDPRGGDRVGEASVDIAAWLHGLGLQQYEQAFRAQAVIVAVRGPDDLERAFSSLKQAQVDGLVVEESPVFIFQAKKLAELAAGAKIPAIYPSYYPEGFASLGPDRADNFQHVAGYTGKILKGAKPADLPVLRSEKTLLMVNSKAAKDLGIAVPPQVRGAR